MSTANQTQALLERRQRTLGPAYRLFYDNPFHPVRGEGAYLYDAEGNEYLDVYNNVPSVGHSHPKVVEALSRQAAILNTHTRYLHETVLDYADSLLATFPAELSSVMFTCTGSEANDLAVRLSRAVTGNKGMIVTQNAYHGVTAAISEMSPSLGAAVTIPDHVCVIPSPDSYRLGGDALKDAFADSVAKAIATLEGRGIKMAAILFDTLFSADGLFPDPADFIVPAVELVRKAGGLYIADEVQAGLGRVGDHMWGFQRHAVTPDIVTLGKPMGNGHPLAGMVTRHELLVDFGNRTRYFNTFGGNPVSAAVGKAVLDVVRDEGLMQNALDTGNYVLQQLRSLHASHEVIGDVRGVGLYSTVEVVSSRADKTPDPKVAAAIVNLLRERKVLVGAFGLHANCLKIRPPLPFSRANADRFIEVLDGVLRDVSRAA